MLALAIYIFMIVTVSLVCRKTGHPVWYGLIGFIPGLGQILLAYYLAYSDWPRWTEAGLDQMSGTQDDLDQVFE